MRDFNEGIDAANIAWLAALPTPGTLFEHLIDQQESDLDPTMTWSQVTQTPGTAVMTKSGLTSSGRTIDLGASSWGETGPTTSRAIAVTDTAAGGKLYFVQNLTDGSMWNDPTLGPELVDDLTIKLGYQGEA